MKAQRDAIHYDFLKEVSLFDGLNDLELQKVFKIGKTRECKAGTNIVVEGQQGGSLHIIVDGKAEVFKSRKGGLSSEKRLAKLHQGSVFGEMSVFDKALSSATVRAVTDCSVYVIKGGDFKYFLLSHPNTSYKIFTTLVTLMSNRLRRANLNLSLVDYD